MTVANMHTAVKLGLDKTSGLDIPAYESEELDLWLNIAQDRFVKQRLFGNNYKQEGFEGSVKRVTDLHELVITEILTDKWDVGIAGYPTAKRIDLTVDLTATFMYYINSRSEVTRTLPTITEGYVDNLMIQHNEIPNFVTTGFNSPYFKNPVCWIEDDDLYVMYDSLTTGYGDADHDIQITFIKEPVTMNTVGPVACELADSTHQEIVDITVDLMIENIESARTQTHTEKLKTQE